MCSLVRRSFLFFLVAASPSLRAQDNAALGGAPRSKPALLDRLVAATKAPALTIPAGSITNRQWPARFTAWARKQWQAKLAAELKDLQVPDAETTAGKMIDWFALLPGGGKANDFTERMRKSVPKDAEAPIAQFLVGNMCIPSLLGEESRARLQKCVAATKGEKGAPLIAALAAARFNGENNRPADDVMLDLTIDFLAEAFAPGDFTDEDGEYLAHVIGVRLAVNAHELLAPRLLEVYQKSALPEWVKHYAVGKTEIQIAWRARGNGMGPSVTAEGWKGFGEHLAIAGRELKKAWQLKPDRPEAATEMIGVAMAGYPEEGDDMRAWFDRAIAAQMDYPWAYEKMTYGLRPRWSGSLDQMLAFGISCARTGRYDTKIPNTFTNVLGQIALDLPDYRPLLKLPEVIELLLKHRRAQVELARAEGSENDVQEAQAYLVATAFLVDQPKVALSEIPALNDARQAIKLANNAENWLLGWNVDWRAAHMNAVLSSGNAAGDWQRAQDFRKKRLFEEALAAAAEAQTNAPAARAWLEQWSSLASCERDFARGESVSLPLNLVAWQAGFGEWRAGEKDRFTGKLSSLRNPLYLYSRARLGENFELKGNIQLRTAAKAHRFSFGVVFGHNLHCVQPAQDEYVLMVRSVYPESFRVEFGQRQLLRSRKVDGGTPPIREKNSFRVERRGRSINAWVNDEHVLKNAHLPERLTEGECATGLTAFPYDSREAVFFSDLAAKKLAD
jgi:hypothetical protein